ncbi:hypothetical protein PG985_014685 [Apiospora marii]|uniref:Uncharacterized protein n=1 Tax=Apiospora marii TaxID=335849 RepID=A0ABR1R4A3_9PEZI
MAAPSTSTSNMLLFLTALLSAQPALSERYMPVDYAGIYNLSSGVSNTTASLYAQAAANPNATRSVKLHPFDWYQGNNPDYYQNIEWEWRVNVSDFAATNAQNGMPLVDPHVELTTYDFSWSGGKNLSDQIRSEDPVCITVAMSRDWPANVTNRYADGNTDDGSCDTVLGEECRRAIEKQGMSGSSSTKCQAPTKSWNELPECADSFGYAYNLTGSAGYVSGTGFYAFNSAPRNETNETAYYEATNALHVVMVNTMLPITNGAMGKARLMCMRVNTTKVEWEDPESSATRGAGISAFATALVGAMMMMAMVS